MADNTKKVTIDAEWFDELRSAASGERYKTLEAAYNQVRTERDELKAKLAEHADLLQRTEAERVELKAKLDCADVDRETYKDRAEAAERCIEEAFEAWTQEDGTDASYNRIGEILRAYREKEEEAR